MFPISVKHIPTPNNAEIVDICRNTNCTFLLVLLRNSFQLRTLNSQNCAKITTFKRSDGSIKKYGYNKWVQWIDSNNFIVGTQLCRIIFLRIGKDGIEERDSFTDQMITAYCASLGFLVLAIDGPKLLFYSTDAVLNSMIEFENPKCDVIIGMSVCHFEDYDEIITAFSNRNIKRITIKLEKGKLKMVDTYSLNFENDIVETKNYFTKMIVRNKSGMLLLIDRYGGETLISENTSLFKGIFDCDYVISVSENKYLNIWSSQLCQNSYAKLYNEKNEKIIACETDINGSRFFYATPSNLYLIIFAIQNHFFPSLYFHSSDIIYFPEDNRKIDVDDIFIKNCFPITSFAY